MENNHKIVDLSYLNEISDGSNDLIKDLIEMFFEQIPEYQKSLNDCYSNKDWINLGKTAHKAKSAILMVGMKELANVLKNLEENAKEGKNINGYKEIIAKFVSESNIAVRELKEIKKIRKY
ncbi:MAG: Hpt domain-containing protein [Bacteroidales bacterium]|jgi:HPt (histidine-containing phosphotransfer) domain-containing protein|nr:Hpt domain-containing protein [Bacteroidales bacterium]